jgi:hypothetical protein
MRLTHNNIHELSRQKLEQFQKYRHSVLGFEKRGKNLSQEMEGLQSLSIYGTAGGKNGNTTTIGE